IVLLAVIGTLLYYAISGLGTMVAAASAMAASAQVAVQQTHASSMAAALRAHAQANNAYPSHAVELLNSGSLTASDFSLSTNPLAIDAIPVGTTNLGQFELAKPATRQQITAQVVASVPKDV